MVPHSSLFQVSIQSGHRLGLLAGLLEGAARSHLALRRTSFLHAPVAIGSVREFESDLTDWRKDLSRLRLANLGSRCRSRTCSKCSLLLLLPSALRFPTSPESSSGFTENGDSTLPIPLLLFGGSAKPGKEFSPNDKGRHGK